MTACRACCKPAQVFTCLPGQSLCKGMVQELLAIGWELISPVSFECSTATQKRIQRQ